MTQFPDITDEQIKELGQLLDGLSVQDLARQTVERILADGAPSDREAAAVFAGRVGFVEILHRVDPTALSSFEGNENVARAFAVIAQDILEADPHPTRSILNEWSDARAVRIHRPPGGALAAIANLFSLRTRERILLPIIADMQEEHFQELAAGRSGWATWVRIRGAGAFAYALVTDTLFGKLLRLVAGTLSFLKSASE